MERGKRTEAINGEILLPEAINGEILLPEAIIQHIQSLLTGKQAVQTTMLSKSWYGAWLTRPNLDFDQHGFPRNGGDADPNSKFSGFTRKTMQRYEELNLKIESFRLCMVDTERDSCLLAHELILKAMKIGAIDLNFEFMSRTKEFVFPHEVFGSENLVRLSVSGCIIDLGDGKICCSRLESLSLGRVYVEGDIIWDIVSNCPLIEKLSLNDCQCQFEEQRSRVAFTKYRALELSPFVEFGKQNVESFVDGPIVLYEFHKLTCLYLRYLNIDSLFFCDFSSKFPCLKDLNLDQCMFSNKIAISSHSLEYLRVSKTAMLRAKFDVPSLRLFSLISSHMPSLIFGTTSRGWEFHMSVECSSKLKYSWFCKFNKFLSRLSSSKFFLSFFLTPVSSLDYDGDIQHRPLVENLTINAHALECSAFWDGFLGSCRPKFITTTRFCKYDMSALEFACRRLTQQVGGNCFIPNQSMFGQYDLEEVNLETFDETIAQWQLVTWKTLFEASTSLENKHKIRFHLRWREEPTTTWSTSK